MKFLFKLILTLSLVFPSQLIAQQFKFSKHFNGKDSTQVHILETRNGDLFRGQVIDMKDKEVFYLADGNVSLRFKFSEIKSIKVEGKDRLLGRRDGVYEVANPQNLFYHSTAFGLERGETVYNNVDLFWNSVDVGFGKGFSVGVEVMFPVLISAKMEYTRPVNDKLKVGLSMNVFALYYDPFYDFDDKERGVYLYGIATVGSPKLHLNVTAGILRPIFVGEDDFELGWNNYLSSFGFGGMLGKHFSYQAETLIYRKAYRNNNIYINLSPSFALGWQGRISRFDVGLISYPDSYFEIIPYISYKIQF